MPSRLTTETQEQKLARLLPGAKVRKEPTAQPHERFVVDGWRMGRNAWEPAVLSTGATEREAIDRAVFLYGSQR